MNYPFPVRAYFTVRPTPSQVKDVVVETWGESQIAVGDTVTAIVTIVREHASEYRGIRRRWNSSNSVHVRPIRSPLDYRDL